MNCTSCPTETAGQYGTAVSFNGTSNTLAFTTPETFTTTTVPSQLGVVDGSFTVMAWVNNSDWNGSQAVLGSSPADGLFVGLQNGAPFLGYDGDDNVSTETVPTNSWTHVTWRFDAAAVNKPSLSTAVLAGEVITGTLPYDGNQRSASWLRTR
jgi:hypothetical protein